MKLTPSLLESALLNIVESERFPQERFIQYSEKFNGVLSFVFSDELNFLTEADKRALTFITDVLLLAYQNTEAPSILEDVEDLEEILEEVSVHWEKTPGDFTQKTDAFYERSKEQEAVALLEEVLEEDEEISKEGKEAIFLTAYTIIEVMGR